MDEKKKNPEEEIKDEKKPGTAEEPKGDISTENKPKDTKPDEKSEEKPTDEKQADENGEGTDKTDDKVEDKPAEKSESMPDEGKADDEPNQEDISAAPDEKDEEILRLKTQIAAMQLGISLNCIDDAVAIAESYVKTGKNDDISSALSAVIKKYPNMKCDDGKDKKSSGFKVGAGNSDKEEKADDSRLSNAFGIKKKK